MKQADGDLTQQTLASDKTWPAVSDQARLAWQLRPAARPTHEAPKALADLWSRFRHELIGRLAQGQALTDYEKSLSTLHDFDERWNVVGTPAQVQDASCEPAGGLIGRERACRPGSPAGRGIQAGA